MTVQDLHDALGLLPMDLVTAVDTLRVRPRPRVIIWRRLIPLAACLVLLVSTGLALQRLTGGGKADTTAQAPAAAAPMEAADEEAAIQEAPASDEVPNDGHRHGFAEDAKSETGGSGAWCGNTQATIYLDGRAYPLGGSDAIALADIFDRLPYDPALVCRCAAEFTLDTELLTGIGVNLTEGFARCDQGQASLTKSQAEAVRGILDRLG